MHVHVKIDAAAVLPSIEDAYLAAGIEPNAIEEKEYPEETIYVVYVDADELPAAVVIGNSLDRELEAAGLRAFVVTRKSADAVTPQGRRPLTLGVKDERATQLSQLITARSRTSEAQPALSYVRDSSANLASATAPRHTLIFGRRGAGKTALMLEAKRLTEADGDRVLWFNLQTHRWDPVLRVFLYWVRELCDLVIVGSSHNVSQARVWASDLSGAVDSLLAGSDVDKTAAQRVLPLVQRMMKRFHRVEGHRTFVYLDDFYFVATADQPLLLDLMHSALRDCDVWLKIASIKHLTRWYQTDPMLGLQTGHDAAVIDIDVTLQEPLRAKQFLEEILRRFAREAGVRSITTVVSPAALDRLVLASGAVPRDYLVLTANAVAHAQTRAKSRLVGVQDVNQAAGDAGQVKVRELEDDVAANSGSAARILAGLSSLRRFCLDEEKFTYFRVDVRDKERHASQYDLLVSLADLRLCHLVDPSVSATHAAGERSEVYMLDLSQFSGMRLKQNIRVLDLSGGLIVSKQTGVATAPRVGKTPRALITILRGAPQLELSRFDLIVRNAG